MKKSSLFLSTALVALSSLAHAQTDPVLTLDASKVTAKVSPTLYGLMTEEINYSYEGGLYAETIHNRIFRDKNPLDHWAIVQDAGGTSTITLDESQPIPNTVLKNTLKLDASAASAGHRVGVANDGYWGIPVKPKTTYRLSFYAKAAKPSDGPLTASIESPDGATTYAKAQIAGVSGDWKQYTATLTTGADVAPTNNARFVISTETPATVWLDLVSLFPPTFNDRPNGNRPDVMQLLSDMKPTFLRLPGGNFLEGNTIADRFPWKQTIGPLDQRPGHWGCWGYGANDGMGLLEFLEWCEDLHIQPVLAVYAGYSLKGDHVNPGPDLQPFVDDALDEIEYVTGDASTKWGAERAKGGHPAPFPLTYVEIGNEDGFDKSHSYDGRFTQFFKAIKAKYPNLKLIATAGGKDPLGSREKVTQCVPDLYDEHYYRSPEALEADATRYDTYDRNGPKIFVGEWASQDGIPTTNLKSALADAAWMTGFERNADVVVMASYAPLFTNVNKGGTQWKWNLIGYDGLSSYGSPSYYAQKMFNTHLGDNSIAITGENIGTQTWQPPGPHGKNGAPPPPQPAPKELPTLYYAATRDSSKGTIYLKVVNIAGAAQPVQIHIKGVTQVAPEGALVTLSSGSPGDTNTITEPTKVVPVEAKATGLGANFTQTFPPYSVTVLQLETQ